MGGDLIASLTDYKDASTQGGSGQFFLGWPRKKGHAAHC